MNNVLPIASRNYDIAIVGGGIIGLAVAREFLLRNPRLRLIVFEKEAHLGRHQTGHNSGVIHSGIYYKPGSTKARACVAGHHAMILFCQERGIPFERCGKVIIALNESELPRLNDLYLRGVTNGVRGLELIDPPRLHELEPHAAGIKAIYSPQTSIVDYSKVAEMYAEDVTRAGGEIHTGRRVTRIETRGEKSILVTDHAEIETRFVVTCAGLYSDKISKNPNEKVKNTIKIIPFRGDYYKLKPERRHLVRGLIYPVPDPHFPFLGIHYTRILNGEVWLGPNAVLAFAREGYQRWDVNLPELMDTLTFPGFWKMAAHYWRQGAYEMYADYVKSAYVRAAQKYLPSIRRNDLMQGPSGVRAQALDNEGTLVDDFVIVHGPHVAHVKNAPSPAATSSLIIARMVADEIKEFQ